MKKELAKTYSPKDFEDRLYHEWEEKKYFHAEIDPKKKPYTIVIPSEHNRTASYGTRS